jgi:N utilization substance protein B
MTRRSQARKLAFQILYQDDLNPPGDPAANESLLRRRLASADLVEFAQGLISGVNCQRQQIDLLIERTAANWSLERMAATERNVLRLGAYEILYCDTPDRVAINEAVELAKLFGSAQSAQFVNGILDRLMHVRQ